MYMYIYIYIYTNKRIDIVAFPSEMHSEKSVPLVRPVEESKDVNDRSEVLSSSVTIAADAIVYLGDSVEMVDLYTYT
jgi:hypothetical protein